MLSSPTAVDGQEGSTTELPNAAPQNNTSRRRPSTNGAGRGRPNTTNTASGSPRSDTDTLGHVEVDSSEPSGSCAGAVRRSDGRRGSLNGDMQEPEPHPTEAVTPELLKEERERLVREKQRELKAIDDRNTDLVRELFHLEKYKLMTNFDLEAARADNSPVFNNYKATYDLLAQSGPIAGPSRMTRRADTELRQALATSASAVAEPSSKAKGKQRAQPGSSAHATTPSARSSKKRGENGDTGKLANGKADEHEGPPTIVVRKAPKKLNGILRHTSSMPDIQSLHGSKQLDHRPSPLDGTCPQSENAPRIHFKKTVRVLQPRPRTPPPSNGKRKAHDHATALDDTLGSPPSTGLSIKRIKLIVRRPPPSYTNPKQRPPPPKFNKSLSALLDSYICISDEDIDQRTLMKQVKHEAEIREKEQLFRKHGRFIPGTQVLFGSIPDESVYIPPSRDWKDTWDLVVEEVVARGKVRARKPMGSMHMASQVAAKVQAYYDSLEVKKAKALEEEKKRLRNLAKSTMKLVTAEWKKAVFYIREKQRKAEEAEELKRGQDHLDAILDQSGQILETQQGHLFRSRSRTGSVDEWGVGDDDQDDDDDDMVDEAEEGDEDEDEDMGEPRLGTVTSSRMSPEDGDEALSMAVDESRAPTTIPSDDESDDDEGEEGADEVGTSLLLGGSEPLNVNASPTPGTPSVLEDDHDHTTSTAQLPVDVPQPPSETRTEDVVMQEPDLLPSEPPGPPSLADIDAGQLETFDMNLEKDNLIANDAADTTIEPAPALNGGALPPDGSEPPMDAKSQTGPELAADEPDDDESDSEDEHETRSRTPSYLRPYAVAPVEWDPSTKVSHPLLLRGVLRPYQQSGLEWLASLHTNRLNGILADEMGLGKTIQTIALLAHLACDRGIWGPHLIVVPTSVLLNWEMEFKKFLPGFKVLSYHGSTKRRKELRHGWNDKFHFNVCITSYALVAKDAHIFKRKAWYYMILDEAHMIKNFKSQRWNILLMFRSFRRLLLTGTPLQNNLTELWALLQFLMSGSNFANLKEFGEWFSNPLERAIEMGSILDEENLQRVSKLHTVLRPYLLRRLKRDVEKELPRKVEHLTLCPLSKRQRFLYDEFMSRAQTRDALQSGVYQKIANILMQLRKVCNHPDLFEVRPIVTSFAMSRSAIADFEIQELLVRRRLLAQEEDQVDLRLVGFQFIDRVVSPAVLAQEIRTLDATRQILELGQPLGQPPPNDARTVAGFRAWSTYQARARTVARWAHQGYLNRLRCSVSPIFPEECFKTISNAAQPIIPFEFVDTRQNYFNQVYLVNKAVKSYTSREGEIGPFIDRFAFVTPPVVAMDLPRIALAGFEEPVMRQRAEFDQILHRSAVKLQVAFPDPSLLQYDCGKLQVLADLLRERKAGGHRALIFTQMTRILDVLESFLNYHGYLYLRLDGATKIEDRQYITERFNADPRIFCFISSSRSGGVGINLTGADTVIFYDSDFNPQMDRQCEDRAHRIGQIRDVHIYRFVSQHTVEEAMLRKANQKRSLDDIVIQKGEFDWRTLFHHGVENENDNEDDGGSGMLSSLTKALDEFDDFEDRQAAAAAEREENSLLGADTIDFGEGVKDGVKELGGAVNRASSSKSALGMDGDEPMDVDGDVEDDDEGGAVADYMVRFVEDNYEFFRDWRL